MVNKDDPIKATQKHVASKLGEETVILGIDESMYYGLDEIGAQVWDLLQEPTTIDDICTHLMKKYEVDRETCVEDVTALVQELIEHNLVELKSESP